jgi:hypothetical protein
MVDVRRVKGRKLLFMGNFSRKSGSVVLFQVIEDTPTLYRYKKTLPMEAPLNVGGTNRPHNDAA